MKKILYVSPINSRSGYGDHAREFVKYLLTLKENYEIDILATPWGSNPTTALEDDVELANKISDMFVNKKDIKKDYDLYVQLGLPTEFQCVGKTNIGITAGVETDKVTKEFVKGCNQMDTIIVPSEFTRKSFESTEYTENKSKLKVVTPIEVVHEYASCDFYNDTLKESDSTFLNSVKEDFCFLFVGQWVSSTSDDGGRKNLKSLIRTFKHTFSSDKFKNKPALVLKTNGTNFSISDFNKTKDDLRKVIANESLPSSPNIYLLHSDMTHHELVSLYRHPKVKVFASHTRGEGFGRPALEATLSGIPVLTSFWSGHLDFLNKDQSLLIPGELECVGVSNDMFASDAHWIQVDEMASSARMKNVFTDYEKYKTLALDLQTSNRSKFTEESAFEKYTKIFEKLLGQ